MFTPEGSSKEYKLKQLSEQRGVDFGGWISPLQLYKNGEDGHGYEPCYLFDDVMEGVTITREDAVLDLGCGKGYAMYLLRQYPFGRIDGVEMIQSLAQTARDNMDKLFGFDSRIHVYWDDVNDWTDYDTYSYFFMFNPFGEATTMNVGRHIIEAANRTGAAKYVIYQLGNYVQGLLDMGFRKVSESEVNCLLVYEGKENNY